MDSRQRQAALDLARQGDGQALGELLESFRPYARALVQGFRDERLQSQVDDSDMIQDAFLEVQRSFAGFRGRTVAEFVVWLRQVVLRSAGRTFRHLVDRPRAADATAGAGGPSADPGSSPSAWASR